MTSLICTQATKRRWVICLFQDLTKWKNRRRSTKSDLRRKSQDREHVINQMTNWAKNEAQGGSLKRYIPAMKAIYNLELTLPNPVAPRNLFKVCVKSR